MDLSNNFAKFTLFIYLDKVPVLTNAGGPQQQSTSTQAVAMYKCELG